jgi:hypothetical protein
VGVENLNLAKVVSSNSIEVAGALVPISPTELATGTSVLWCIRPERVTVVRDDEHVDSSNGEGRALRGILNDVADTGTAYDLFVSVGDGLEIKARTWETLDFDVGSRCRVEFDPEGISLWAVPTIP